MCNEFLKHKKNIIYEKEHKLIYAKPNMDVVDLEFDDIISASICYDVEGCPTQHPDVSDFE